MPEYVRLNQTLEKQQTKHHILSDGAHRPLCGQDNRSYEADETVRVTKSAFETFVDDDHICSKCLGHAGLLS